MRGQVCENVGAFAGIVFRLAGLLFAGAGIVVAAGVLAGMLCFITPPKPTERSRLWAPPKQTERSRLWAPPKPTERSRLWAPRLSAVPHNGSPSLVQSWTCLSGACQKNNMFVGKCFHGGVEKPDAS
eukprot:349679-Chlamydomonas_euryale.AAC.17